MTIQGSRVRRISPSSPPWTSWRRVVHLWIATSLGLMLRLCIGEPQRGQSCNKHHVCGSQLCEGSYVCFRKTRFAWRGGDKKDVLEVFHLNSGIMGCKVGYLPKHLASRADCYDGLCARILEIYSSDRTRCASVTKHQKYHRGVGCCVANIEGMRDMFVIA